MATQREQSTRQGEELTNKAKQTADDVAREAKRTAEAQASSQKQRAVESLSSVADNVRKAGDEFRGEQPQIASMADQAAARIEDAAQYLREHDTRELVAEAEDYARREPMIVLGGAFALGVLFGRMVRSGAAATMSDGSRSRSRYSQARDMREMYAQPEVEYAYVGSATVETPVEAPTARGGVR